MIATYILCLVALPFFSVLFCRGQDVLTCGGFIKSDQAIDFSKIDIQLLTKFGALRETSDCSPTNGYFLLPVYDKGEYVIRVAPPTGWSFDPSEVTLSVDGASDVCSRGEDIVFYFTGFSLTGQVLTVGRDTGPSGVTVQIVSSNDIHSIVRETESTADGRYELNSVLPGQYILRGSHPLWTISKKQVKIDVTADTLVIPSDSIQVEGFDVKGRIQSKGEPVSGVQFLLYSQDESNKFSCESRSSSGACITVSEVGGVFSYPSLPPGDYRLLPHYENSESKFQVFPTEVFFAVTNDSVLIEPTFEVQGFTVFGRILSHKEGNGLEGIMVSFGGNLKAKTDKEGHYQLLNISAGSYTVKVEISSLQFEPVTVEVNPGSPHVPDIVPSHYSVCGHVTITVHPKTHFKLESRAVNVVSVSEKKMSTKVNSNGDFCFMLTAGEYSISAPVSPDETKRGLSLLPKVIPVTVATGVVTGLRFEQYVTSLTGSMTCLLNCVAQAQVSLVAAAGLDRTEQTTKVIVTGATAFFEFNKVLPGKYKVSLVNSIHWCWDKEELPVDVLASSEQKVPLISFNQTGYLLTVYSSHNTHLNVYDEEQLLTLSFTAKKGLNNMCINTPGQYSLIPSSCYQFDGDVFMFLTAIPAPLTLTAVSHVVNVSVYTPPNGKYPVTLTLTRKKSSKQLTVDSTTTDSEGGTVYHYSFIEKPGTSIKLTPHSANLLCSPVKQDYTIKEECPEVVPSFHCHKGLFISGHVEPPLVGVSVTIANSDTDQIDVMTVKTDDKGQYSVGPLPHTSQYTATPSYDQYVFEPMENDPYSFKAMRKSQLTVKISDKSGNLPLLGVLVSLNGEGYRNSSTTAEDGCIVYTDIFPGQYYTKPLLREFEFQPPSMVVTVKQGENLMVDFVATRVAFSCNGKVASLNGSPLEAVNVQLTALGDDISCKHYQDNTVSDSNGAYRFRGLQPSCEYQLSLVTDERNSLIERALPETRNFRLMEGDINGEDFAAILRSTKVFVTGNVVINNLDLLSHVKVGVYSDKYLEALVYSVVTDPMGFFHFPALPLNPSRTYYVQLETTLSPQSYKTSFSATNVSFTADRDKHVTFHLTAESIPMRNVNGSKGSFVGIFLAIAALFAVVNIDKILALQTTLTGGQTRKTAGKRY